MYYRNLGCTLLPSTTLMTATNHALSGALIAAFLPPPIAIPAAFLSHFVLDAIPHFGFKQKDGSTGQGARTVIYADSMIAMSANIPAIVFHKWTMLACGWIAYSPDIPILIHYFRYKNMDGNHHWPFKKRLFTLPHREYRWGIAVEVVLAVVMYWAYIRLVQR